MRKHVTVLGAAVLAVLAACGSESPTTVYDAPAAPSLKAEKAEVVVTEGVAVPTRPKATRPSLSAVSSATASLGGSSSTPLSLTPQSCSATASQQVVVTYTITGRQDNPASFQLNTQWMYNGSSWTGSAPTTVSVAPRTAMAAPTVKQVTVNVTNASATSSGTSTLVIPTFNLVTSAPAALATGTAANVTVHVAFGPCAVTNTAPTLVVPADMTVEATSSAGAVVTFTVTATDAEDGNLTGSVSCTPASGSTFPLGETTVSCSVTDAGGLSASGSFKVKVVDTTPAYFTSFPTGTINLIAADIHGAVLDVDALGITVEDVGHVSEPSTFACDYVAGTVLAIGSTTTVSCTAKDAIGNESAPSTFDVFVGLNVNATGFLPPLRTVAPFSSHKLGSTIPHKFLPPTYADGTPATDLATGLRLVLVQQDGSPDPASIDGDDYSAGSTTWRYDPDAGQYIFNLKTGTKTPWDVGTWTTTVSYAGITLATTQLNLRR
jgi:HYR domain